MYVSDTCSYVCTYTYPQFYFSDRDMKKDKSTSTTPMKEDSPEYLFKELLEESFVTELSYSTSYCWPLLNNKTLGQHRQQPAQSCEHILSVNITISNGFYWIDPNLGCSSDAILVYCNFTSRETCIHPNSTQVCTHITHV